MKQKRIRFSFLLMGLLVLTHFAGAQSIITSNDFENCESGYTEFGSYSDGSSDYFVRSNGSSEDTSCVSSITSGQIPFTNSDGFYYTGEDTDRPLENPNIGGDFGSVPFSSGVHFSAIDVSGHTNVKLKLDVAARANISFEPDLEYLKIYVDTVNTGNWHLIGAFEVENSIVSDSLSLDTDLDGVGDGTQLTEAFQTFTFDVPSGATIMNVRIEMNSSSGSEEIAFDTFIIEGDNNSVPPSASIVSNDFENCESGYTEFGSYSDGSSDYFIRANGTTQDTGCATTTASSQLTFTNTSGYYYTGEDTDRPLENPNNQNPGLFGSQQYSSGVHFSAIDVSGYTNVKLKLDVAARASISFEPNLEYLKIYVDKGNTGNWHLIGAFEVENNITSDSLALDTDLDGVGDGTKLTEAFQTFAFDVPSGATIMNVRIEMNSSSGSEEIAFDTFIIEGTNNSVPLSASITSQTNVLCNGDNTGSITVTAAGGDANYTYVWSDGSTTLSETTNTISSLGAGTYTVTITDGNGDIATASATITIDDSTLPNVQAQQNVAVYLNAAGNASITATDIDNNSSDNCGISSITVSPSAFNCSSLSDSISCSTFALDFDGTNDHVRLNNSANLTPSGTELTIEGWVFVKANSTTTQQFFHKWEWIQAGNTAKGYTMEIFNQRLSFVVGLGANQPYEFVQSAINDMPYQQWVHIAGVCTGTELIIYINGVEKGRKNLAGTPDFTNTTIPLIGARSSDGSTPVPNEFLNGKIDDIAVWSVAKTQNEIQSELNQCVSNSTNGLLAVWSFEEGAGSTASDGISTNDGTLVNMDPTTDWVAGATNLKNQGTIVTLTVVDNNGNSANATSIVSVFDTIAPTVVAQDVTVYLDGSGNASIAGGDVDNGSTDNCGIASLSVSPNTFDCSDLNYNASNDYALRTDGVNDYLDMGDLNNALDFSSQGTYQIWMRPLAVSNIHQSYIESNDDVNYLSMESGAGVESARIGMWVKNGAVAARAITVNDVITVNQWTNYTVVYDGTQAINSDRIKIYVNGVQQASFTYGTVPTTLANLPGFFMGSQRGTSQFANNDYDEVRVWSNALSAAEIQANWNQTITGNENGLVAYYAFEDGPGSPIVTELTSQGPATLNNMDPNTAWIAGAAGLNGSSGQGVTLTVTDNNGNSSTANAAINVLDTVAPTTVCQNITVFLDALGNASIAAADVDGGSTDNCAIESMSIDINNFTCANVGSNNVMLTVTDSSGNVSICTSTVTVEDTITPTVIAQDITVGLDALGNATITTTDVNSGSNDACGIASLAIDKSSFDCTNVGANTVILTVVDNNGNTSTATATVTIVDNIAPVITDNQNLTAYVLASGAATSINVVDFSSAVSDNCGVTSIQALNDPLVSCNRLGSNTIFLQAFDNNNNLATGSVTVNIVDTVAPNAITQDLIVYLDASGNASITTSDVDNGSTDNCGISSLTVSPNSFTCANTGANTVTLTLMDNSGNTSSSTAVVTVDAGFDTDSDGIADICDLDDDNDGILDTDECSNAQIAWGDVQNNKKSKGFGDIAGVRYDLSSTNTTFASDTVFGHANFPASFGLPNQISFETRNNTSTNDITFSIPTINPVIAFASIGDSNGAVSISFDSPVELIFSQNVVLDSPTQITGTNGYAIVRFLGTYSNISFEYLSNSTNVNFVIGSDLSTTCVADIDGDGIENKADLDSDGDGCVDAIEAGHLDPDLDGILGTSPVTVDADGLVLNEGGYTGSTALVIDSLQSACNQPPIASCQDITLYADASCQVSISNDAINNGSSDPDGDVLAYTISSNGPFTVGIHTVTMTVTDPDGEFDSCTATITVVDSTAPVAQANNLVLFLDALGNASITVADVDNGSFDNCGISTIDIDRNTFGCSDVGVSTSVLLSVTDNSGNTATQTANIVVVDSIKPTVTANNHVLFLDASGKGFITASDVVSSSFDACGIESIGLSDTMFDCSNLGPNTITITATDGNFNKTETTATVIVVDSIKPTLNLQDITVYLDATGKAFITAADIDNGSFDACGIESIGISDTMFDCSTIGANSVDVTATDGNFNKANGTVTVTVVDSLIPTAQVNDVTVYLDANGNASITAADVDNGSTDNCGIASISINPSTFDCSSVNGSGLQIVSDSTWMESSIADSSNSLTFPWAGANFVPASSTFTLPVSLGQPYNFVSINPIPGSEVIRSHTHVRYYSKTFSLSNLDGINTRIRLSVDDDIEVYINGHLLAGEYSFSQSSFQGVPHDLFIDSSGVINGNNGGDLFGFVSTTALDSILVAGTNEIILAVRNRQGNDRGGFTFVMDVNGNSLGNPVVLTVTDVNGNSTQDVAMVTVIDTVSPVISQVPVSFTAYTLSDDCTPPVFWQLPVASDACAVQSLASSHHPGDHFAIGTTTVVYNAIDVNGNMASTSFDITVVDTTAPSAICQNITVALDASGNAAITAADIDNGSFDACGIASTSIDVSAFNCANVGANNVVLTLTDIYGNTSTCTSIVTVVDAIGPEVQTNDVVVYLDANGNASIVADDINNGSTDVCGIASVSVSPLNFDCSDVNGDNGITIVTDSTWTLSTQVDSSTALTFPWAGAPSVPGSSSFTLPVTIGQPYGYVSINPIPGSEVIRANRHITFYRKTFNLSSLDQLGTRIRMSVDDDLEIYVNGHLLAAEYSFSQSSFQGVPHDLLIDSSGVTNGYNGGDLYGYTSTTSLDSVFVLGTNEIIVAVRNRTGADRGGLTMVMDVFADFQGNAVTLSVTDVNGNVTTALATVTVIDTIAPVITQVPASFTAYTLSDDCTPPVYWTLPLASDACAIQSLNGTHHPSDHFPVGVTTVTYTAIDVNGNTSDASFDVTVLDTIAPTAIAQNITLQLDSTGNASITAADIDNGSSDFCGIASISVDVTSFNTSNIGVNTVILTVIDNSGNTTSVPALVTIEDDVPPVAICQDITVALGANGLADITAAMVDNGSFDAIGTVSVSINTTSFSCANVGNNIVTLTVTDANGNVSTCQSTVMVIDTIAPVVLGQDIIVELDANGTASIAANDIDNGSSDACGIASITVTPSTFGCADVGTNAVVLTVTDNNGNVSTVNATVLIEESSSILITQQADISLDCNTSVGGRSVSWNDPKINSISSCNGGGNSCPSGTSIPGFIYLGQHNGHRYFCSDNSNYTWNQANAAAQTAGGHLAVINDATENHYLACRVQANYSWIGLTDQTNEGQFNWVTGDSLGYSKWAYYEPNNTGGYYCGAGGADHTVLRKMSGVWYDRRECNKHEFIMEVPCASDIVLNQVAGPSKGSIFTTGTTTVTYVAMDTVSGATDSMSFDVTIGDCTPVYCQAGGSNTSYEWIQKVKIGSMSNNSGNDNGYADYTSHVAHANTGDWVNLKFYPGFTGQKFKEYWTVFVDWNNDGDFNDYKECVFQKKSKYTVSGSIKVPYWAAQGNLRVRVIMNWGGYSHACCQFSYGEVEDYAIVIDDANGGGAWSKNGEAIVDTDDELLVPTITQELFNLYPNPALSGQVLSLDVRSAKDEETELHIFNGVGQLVYTQKVEVREGLNSLEVNPGNLATGTYIMQMNNQTESIPFIVK